MGSPSAVSHSFPLYHHLNHGTADTHRLLHSFSLPGLSSVPTEISTSSNCGQLVASSYGNHNETACRDVEDHLEGFDDFTAQTMDFFQPVHHENDGTWNADISVYSSRTAVSTCAKLQTLKSDDTSEKPVSTCHKTHQKEVLDVLSDRHHGNLYRHYLKLTTLDPKCKRSTIAGSLTITKDMEEDFKCINITELLHDSRSGKTIGSDLHEVPWIIDTEERYTGAANRTGTCPLISRDPSDEENLDPGIDKESDLPDDDKSSKNLNEQAECNLGVLPKKSQAHDKLLSSKPWKEDSVGPGFKKVKHSTYTHLSSFPCYQLTNKP